jgi:hypothetical protein
MATVDIRQYEWNDLTIIVGGMPLTKARGLKYTTKIEREALYAKGRKPHSIQSGNISYEGELTLLQSDYERLVEAGGGTVLSLSMDIQASYGNPSQGQPMITDRIIGAQFTEEAKELKQGDKQMEITLPFIALDIQKQV